MGVRRLRIKPGWTWLDGTTISEAVITDVRHTRCAHLDTSDSRIHSARCSSQHPFLCYKGKIHAQWYSLILGT